MEAFLKRRATSPKRQPKQQSRLIKALTNPQLRAPFLFIAPAFFIILVFQTLPAVAGLVLSFTKYSGGSPPVFRGLHNYLRLTQDPLFWNGLKVTLQYVVGNVIPSTLLSLALAIALNTKWLWFKAGVRSVYFLPSVISLVSIALVWNWLLYPSGGLFNEILISLKLPKQKFLGSEIQAMPILIIMGIWRALGFNMVIYLAGLQGIDRSYYEAALVDGANSWQAFRHITWPLLWPSTFFIVSSGTIAGFQLVDQIRVMTGGGPIHVTRVLVYYLYERSFVDLLFGYGSSMAVALFLLMLGFTLFQFRFFHGAVEY